MCLSFRAVVSDILQFCVFNTELGPLVRSLGVTFITIRIGDLSLDIVILSINQFYMTFC